MRKVILLDWLMLEDVAIVQLCVALVQTVLLHLVILLLLQPCIARQPQPQLLMNRRFLAPIRISTVVARKGYKTPNAFEKEHLENQQATLNLAA